MELVDVQSKCAEIGAALVEVNAADERLRVLELELIDLLEELQADVAACAVAGLHTVPIAEAGRALHHMETYLIAAHPGERRRISRDTVRHNLVIAHRYATSVLLALC